MITYKFSILDLIPYFLLLLTVFAIYYNRSIMSQKKAVYITLLLTAFSAVRYGVGYDYFNYQYFIDNVWVDIDNIELFPRLLIFASRKTSVSLFFVVTSILIFLPLYKACRNLSIDPAFSVIIYMLCPMFFLESLSIVRNAVAYSLVLWAFSELSINNRFKAMLIFISAICFHLSAIVSLPILLLWKFRNKSMLGLNIVMYISSFLFSYLLEVFIMSLDSFWIGIDRIQGYVNFGRETSGLMSIVVNSIGVVNLMLYNTLLKYDRNAAIYATYVNVGMVLWNLFLPIDSTIALRFSSFYLLFLLIILPYYPRLLLSYRHFVNNFTIVFFMVFFISSFWININGFLEHKGYKISYLPYRTIFYHNNYANIDF